MSKPFKISRSTSLVEVVAVSPGVSPNITVVHRAAGAGGTPRHFVRQIPVPNVTLFNTLQSQVGQGEHIEITAVNEWYDTGYVTYLADFKKVTDTKAEIVTANGGMSVVQNDIAEIVIPTMQKSKTSVRH